MQGSVLIGRTALVTGASRGLGAALVTAFLSAGANVAMHTGRTAMLAKDVDKMRHTDRHLASFHGDLAESGAPEQLLSDVTDAIETPNILVNCAANQQNGMLADQDIADWNRIAQVNVGAVFALSRTVANAGACGSIVNIASIEALRPNRNHAAYAASKAALVSLTRSLALEFGPSGWRANAVAPGLIRRSGIETAWPDGVARWNKATTLERMVEPDEVAAACVFLASSAASGISGTIIPVDCGFLATPGW